MSALKAWWQGLSDHDQRIAKIGGIAAGILLVYFLLWNPLSDAVSNQKNQIKAQQNLLVYLQHAFVKIQAFQASGVTATAQKSGALLTVVESSLAAKQMSAYLQQVQQPENNQAQLTFSKVPFDQLMQWLQTLWTTQGVSVTNFSATRLPMPGLAEVDLTVKSAQ